MAEPFQNEGVSESLAEPAVEQHSQADPEDKSIAGLREELITLAVRLEATRAHLESLIADARRVRKGWEGELEKSQQKVQAASLEAVRTGAETIKAELLKELEEFFQEMTRQAQQQIEKKAAMAIEGVAKAAESSLAALNSEQVSNSIRANLERTTNELAEQFRSRIQTSTRGLEQELSQKLRDTAEGLVESAAELIERHTDDSLEMFAEGVISASRRVVTETEKQIDDAKAAASRVAEELNATVEECRGSAKRTVQEIRDTSARELKEVLEREVQKLRESAIGRVREEAQELTRQSVAKIRTDSGDVSRQVLEAVHKQVGQATVMLQEWQKQARGALETDYRKFLEALGREVAQLSGSLVEQHRQKMRLVLDDLRTRMEHAADVMTGAAGGRDE